MEKEKRKDSPIYPDNYWITSEGEVVTKKTGLHRKFRKTWDGYYDVTLWKDGKGHTKRVHRLVAEAFLPNPENYPVVNHKDGNKLNNNIDNLEWTTVQMNTIHSYANGLQNPVRSSQHGRSKYNEEEITQVCELLQNGHSCEFVSDKTKVSLRVVQSVNTKQNWKHISKNYVFPDRRKRVSKV